MTTTVQVYKSNFNGTAAPWSCDLHYNGKVMKSYNHGYRSRKALEENVEAAMSAADIDYVIQRNFGLDD
jgi:hypothetical protein